MTICDVKTNELGQDHIYTIQCILSFNLFNERIYAFLWLWIFLILIPFAVIDIVVWLNRVLLFGSSYRYAFVKKRLKITGGNENLDKRLLKIFSDTYCGMDGIFVLRLLEHNSNAAVVYDLLNKMWTQFKTEQND